MKTKNEILCMKLATSESEKEVVDILKKEGYWDAGEDHWIAYGGSDSNLGQISAQAKSADKALVEKMTNSIDQLLILECMKRGIDPKSDDAPKSINEALETFFDIPDGDLTKFEKSKIKTLAEKIGVVTTGDRYLPNIAIYDHGTGQSPNTLKDTILSLNKKNKAGISFTHGTYNQGGSAALKFASEHHHLQLVISKKHSLAINKDEETLGDSWCFTIVRREYQEGDKLYKYTYLAPGGNILNFQADSLDLLPGDYPNVNSGKLEHGTYIKLFEYNLTPKKYAGLVTTYLYNRLSNLMPLIGYPVRIYERRTSFKEPLKTNRPELNIKGVQFRLERDYGDNMETNFPKHKKLVIDGITIPVSIFAFKSNTNVDRYFEKSEAMIYSINGQTHHTETKLLFNNYSLRKIKYIREDLFFVVDLSGLSERHKADLLSGDRDGFNKIDFYENLKSRILSDIGKDSDLLQLVKERREKETEKKTDNSLAESLSKLIQNNPTLTELLSSGKSFLKSPINLINGKQKEKREYDGKPFPTYFKLLKEFKKDKPKVIAINNKHFRIQFKTDARNDYFTRSNTAGYILVDVNGNACDNYDFPNLNDGTATLNITLPDNVKVDDMLYFQCTISDDSRSEPFPNNSFYLKIDKVRQQTKSQPGNRKKESIPGKGDDKTPSTLLPPYITQITKDEWHDEYNERSALHIKEDDGKWYYFVNIDNSYLNREILADSKNKEVFVDLYQNTMALIGLMMLHDYTHNKKEWEGRLIEDEVKRFTSILSPLIIPMIKQGQILSDSEVQPKTKASTVQSENQPIQLFN